jgi:hypothetical protein
MTEPQAFLIVGDDVSQGRFPVLLVPNDYAVVSRLPIGRLPEISAGRILITPPADSKLDAASVGTAGMVVFPDQAAETATVLIKLRQGVADVTLPMSGAEFHQSMTLNDNDVIASLTAGGIATELRSQPWGPAIGYNPDEPQPPYGWIPYIPPGVDKIAFGLCCIIPICPCH